MFIRDKDDDNWTYTPPPGPHYDQLSYVNKLIMSIEQRWSSSKPVDYKGFKIKKGRIATAPILNASIRRLTWFTSISVKLRNFVNSFSVKLRNYRKRQAAINALISGS